MPALSQLKRGLGCLRPYLVATLLLTGGMLFDLGHLQAQSEEPQGESSRAAKNQAIRSVPFNRLGTNGDKIKEVVEQPSFYRRMPTRQIPCDPQMFKFLVRRPEVMVNIWDAMGITKVSTRRLSPFSFVANDGVGTTCRCDLVYGDNNLHIYYGNGEYDGNMSPRKVTGRCVCILHSQSAEDASGHAVVSGTMDVFLKLDNLGADLLTRTLGPFVGKTADNNFVETAKFIAQISQVCEHSVTAAYGLATKLDKVEPSVRQEFVDLAMALARSTGAEFQGDRFMMKTQDERLAEAVAAYSGKTVAPPVHEAAPGIGSSGMKPVDGLTDAGSRLNNDRDETPGHSQLDDSTSSRASAGYANFGEIHHDPSANVVPYKPHVYMRR